MEPAENVLAVVTKDVAERTLPMEDGWAAADPSVIGLRLYFETDNARAQATYRALGMTDTTYGLMEVYPLPGRESHVS